MNFQFSRHYTVDEARTLLPQIRVWLASLREAQQRVQDSQKRLGELRESGLDLGGPSVNDWLKGVADLKRALAEFQSREIQIKDLERGLIDFPAFVAGKEVFLCWEEDEEDIEFWHDLDTGYAGRERLD